MSRVESELGHAPVTRTGHDAVLRALLRCPVCSSSVDQREAELLKCVGCGASYAVKEGVPRFVDADNYAETFGFQWNRYRTTQLDSHTGIPISRDRFFSATGLRAGDLQGKRVLDVGCGAGRFAEIALESGAELIALDYSSAVDACLANNHRFSNLVGVVQADLYRMPFESASFDLVYCLGVIQHTPDVRTAFMSLARMVKPGGSLVVDVYRKSWRVLAMGKYWLRPVTKRLSQHALLRLVRAMVPVLWPVSQALARLWYGDKLRQIVPIANYSGQYPLAQSQLREWAVLDTFDMLAPAYDKPQSSATLRRWFDEAGFTGVEVFPAGHLVGRAKRAVAHPRV